MKKNAKILIASAAGIAVLGAATLALVLTNPVEDVTSSTSSEQSTKVSVFSYKTDDILSLTIKTPPAVPSAGSWTSCCRR